MRNEVAMTTAVVVVVTVGPGAAAYAVVAQGWSDLTTNGEVHPIDDNHGPSSPIVTTSEDRRCGLAIGRQAERDGHCWRRPGPGRGDGSHDGQGRHRIEPTNGSTARCLPRPADQERTASS